MTFTKRGITIGDLLLVIVVIILSILITNRVKDSDKQAFINKDSTEDLFFNFPTI